MSADELLPAPDRAVRCAVFADELGVDPGGTALHVDEIVVIDLPRPWPKPVWAKEGVTEVPAWVEAAARAGRRVRVLAAVPAGDLPTRVVHHRRVGAGFRRSEVDVSPQEAVEVLAAVLRDGEGPGGRPGDASAELLVCAQGSHDVCCGSRGPELVAALGEARPDLAVTCVSHIGGHRFAPTALSLPDGRMWGGLDVDTAVAIVERAAPPSVLAARCRGWTGAEPGPAQVAERAVWTAVDDWTFDTLDRSVGVGDPAGGAVVCRVEAGGRTWEVEVVDGRPVPTITCGAPGGLPAKPGREWRVAGLHEA